MRSKRSGFVRRSTGQILAAFSLLIAFASAIPREVASTVAIEADDTRPRPLPRWDAEALVDAGPTRPFQPYAIRLPEKAASAATQTVRSHPEYEPMAGVLFRYSKSDWGGLVANLVAALTGDPAHDEIAWVIVSGSSGQTDAERDFERAGANLDQVRFVTLPTDSIWIRDYGPQFVWRDDTLTLVDTVYFTSRSRDNFVPTLLADDEFRIPRRHNGLYVFGGDFFPGPNRTGFVTSLVNVWNAAYSEDHLAEVYRDGQGIETLHVFPRLPSSVDLTQHIDMWFHVVDRDTVVISRFLPGSHPDAIRVTDDAAEYMRQLGFEVFRVPDHNGWNPDDPQAHFTYANAYRVNDRIFIPGYGAGGSAHAARDAEALAVWRQAAPDAEIVQIDAWEIVGYSGSVACIVMPVPKRVEPDPTAVVVDPDGGEWMLPGEIREIRWGATDDTGVVGVDLLFSADDGATWDNVIALNESPDGRFAWQVPQIETTSARVKVVARDADGRTGESIGAGPFRIASADRHVYDFSTGAGADKHIWGYEVTSWNNVGGRNRPYGVDVEMLDLDARGYDEIAASDATGNSGDGNRYRAPTPSSGHRSAHVFEFTIEEAAEQIRDIELRWEGFGDSSAQVELYVWDHVAQDWCDGRGGCGENRFVANFGGSRDEILSGQIREGFRRFVDDGGRIDLLLYAERSIRRTFHDYVSVTITSVRDSDLDGVFDDEDCAPDDPATWLRPSAAGSLVVSYVDGTTRLQWDAPQVSGATDWTYDTIRSTAPESFGADTAICVETAGVDTASTETFVPLSGDAVFYLVRPANDCGVGEIGPSTANDSRIGRDCP